MGANGRIGALVMMAAWVAAGSPGPMAPAEAGAGDEAVRLLEQLKAHPVEKSSKPGERHGLYLMDVDRGTATLIVDEPAEGLTHCGSARWSKDGSRILFDATPGAQWTRTHVFAIDPGASGPKVTDLGPGNCPSPSPDGKRVAFLLNGGKDSGLWIMDADGSGRRRLGSYGRPYWSPDGRRLLIVGFSEPCSLSLRDVETGKERPLEIPGQEVFSIPSWVDETTIVAALGTREERAIALVDVSDPEHGQVKEILREKDARPRVVPAYPVFSPAADRCLFVNANPKGMSLYSVGRGKAATAKRVERDGFDKLIADIAPSPDGRYLVFCSDRAGTKSP